MTRFLAFRTRSLPWNVPLPNEMNRGLQLMIQRLALRNRPLPLMAPSFGERDCLLALRDRLLRFKSGSLGYRIALLARKVPLLAATIRRLSATTLSLDDRNPTLHASIRLLSPRNRPLPP